jgi:hypothetical protein
MRVCGRLLFVSCAVVMLQLVGSPSAQAKEPTAQEKRAATDGFKSCHEQEGYGDATACWRIWFDKYEHAGTEAEVLFAQERLKRAGVAPKPAPSAPKAPDAKPTGAAPAPTAAPTPAAAPEVTPEATPAEANPAPAPAPVAGVAALTVSGPNLCEQKPNANQPGFSKKRVIVFAPAGADGIESDAAIKRVGGAAQIREVFLQRFPIDRFFNLLTTVSGQAGWEMKANLSKDEIKQYLATATAGADPSITSQLTQSLDCADFLVFPTITAHTLKPVPSGKGAAIELGLEGKLGIFKVSPTGFQLVTTLQASVPGFMDRAQEAAAVQAAKAMSSATSSANGAMAQANKVGDQANKAANGVQNAANQAQGAVQSAGDAATNLANGQVPGALGTNGGAAPDSGNANTLGLPTAPVLKNPLADMHERMSDQCTKAKTPDDNLVCEVRVRAYQLSMHFRDDATDVEGWQLVTPLLFGADQNPAVALGSEEGLKVGNAFVATGPSGERLGYFKVVRVGPGGAAGQAQPSQLNLRLGTATEGMQLREYRVWGLELSAHGSVELLVADSQQHYLPLGTGYAVYKLPSLVAGGGGSLGFDMSRLLSSTETRLRLRAEYLAGTGTGINATVLPIDLSFEKGFYLGKGLNFFLGLGPTLSLVSVKVAAPTAAAGLPSYALSAKRFGGELDTGLDILFSPRVALRFAGIFRYNLGSSYSSADGFDLSADGAHDSFSTLGLNVGLNFTL